ncbi:hypothetical protein PUN28_008689 [Cardiocondyla obscurior]|uniref:Uncharacterized protein n=1 Tax=Cardiocondyla obscurior TaxID=286306 RepID=A0AAW2G0G8_9HYME
MFLCFTAVRDQKATWPSRAPNLQEIAVIRDWMRYHHGHQRAVVILFKKKRKREKKSLPRVDCCNIFFYELPSRSALKSNSRKQTLCRGRAMTPAEHGYFYRKRRVFVTFVLGGARFS